MKMANLYIKLISCIALTVILISMLSSCSASLMDNTKIGKIGNEDVYYDELYYIVENSKSYVKTLHPDNEEAQRKALDEIFKDSLTKSHAIVALAEKHGLSIDDIKSEEITAYVNNYYNGNQDSFDEQLEANHMSERFLKYIAATNILYSQRLPAKLINDGIINESGDGLKAYIKKNFIRVNHLVIINDEGDDPIKNYNKIKEAETYLNNGTYTLEELIGKGYSEDFHDLSGNGYYIAKGSMVEEYEKAAFSLDLYETSDIVKAIGENNNGERAECYYLIQRLPMEEEYIDTHISELEEEYHSSVMSPLLQDEINKLSFDPNATYNSLDLLNLKRPVNSTAIIITVIVIIAVIAITAVIITVIVIKKKLKKKNASYVSGKKKKRK